MYIHSDRLTSLSQSTALSTKHGTQHKAPSLSQSTALGIYAGRVLKACCASYAQGLPLTTKVHWTICLSFAIHALCLVTKLSHHWAMYHWYLGSEIILLHLTRDDVIRKTDEHQNHHYMLCEALCDAHPVIRNTGWASKCVLYALCGTFRCSLIF